VRILDDINTSIQRYMLMVLVTNALVGLLTWIALYTIGLDNAGAWAVAAGVLHIIPYFGPAVTAAAIAMAAFVQFNSLSTVLLAAGDLAGNRHARRHLRHHLDDRSHCQNEHGSGVRHAALLDMVVGCLGHAAELSNHGDRQGGGRECRATAACG
jgi:hypothetical protein